MSKLFDSVQVKAPSRNKFNLSHERKFSFNMGDLVPIMVQEIVPGDSFRTNAEMMMRLAPMLAPIMHLVNVKMEFFFVPNRLVWSEWEDFITGGRLGTSAPVAPQLSCLDVAEDQENYMIPGKLWDYMGLPDMGDGAFEGSNPVNQFVSAIPFRGYQLIYDEYYRDQNVSASLDISTASGVIATAPERAKLLTMRKRAWEKDYFTSCLPFAQRGPDVSIPFGDAAVTYLDETIIQNVPGNAVDPVGALSAVPGGSGSDPTSGSSFIGVPGSGNLRVENIESIQASGTIAELRRSIRLQEWLELAARVGGRYVEVLKGFFDVRPDDARLQRPEYLGGGVTPVQISEVLSTVQQVTDAQANIGTPQGDLTGRGVSYGTKNGFSRFFKEHGYVIGIVSVLPRTAYQQGLPKHFQRFDKFDYFWKQFANIGEQAVLNRELYYDGEAPDPGPQPEDTFGYQSRYAEMKYACSTVHGNFKDTLAFWHMGRIFETDPKPQLNQAFIESDPTHRIFAVDSDDPNVHKLWCHCYLRIDAIRPMPYYGTPSL